MQTQPGQPSIDAPRIAKSRDARTLCGLECSLRRGEDNWTSNARAVSVVRAFFNGVSGVVPKGGWVSPSG
jgi:hypothetical protein